MKSEIIHGINIGLLLLALPAAASNFTHSPPPDRRITQPQFTGPFEAMGVDTQTTCTRAWC